MYGTFSNPFTGSSLKFGTVVILYGRRKEKIEKRSEEVREEDLTNAIIKVQRTEAKKIYFVQGHGEKDPADTERGGYSAAKKALEEPGLQSRHRQSRQRGKSSRRCESADRGGAEDPSRSQGSRDYLNDYLNSGGGVLVMVDPPPAASLESVSERRGGVTPDNDIVLDVSGAGRLMGAGPSIPLVFQYETHEITDRFKGQMTFFPLARSDRAAQGDHRPA